MSEPPSKRRRVELCLEDKVKLIQESESKPKPSLKVLSEKYKMGKSTVSDIIRHRDVYIEQWEKNGASTKFRFGNAYKFDNVNDLMRDWFRTVRSKSIPLSGPIIQGKATQMATALGHTDFKSSNGWLESWKARYSVKGFKISGESACVNKDTVEECRVRLPSIIEGYAAANIFNCDETGLYYRALPDKTLAVRGDGAKGTKTSKDRVTLLFACSATGEKLRPLVIGKAANPRCMKNVKRDRLGVTYVSNKKGWTTGTIFHDWLKGINADMRRQKRHILLFLDNTSSHGHDVHFMT